MRIGSSMRLYTARAVSKSIWRAPSNIDVQRAPDPTPELYHVRFTPWSSNTLEYEYKANANFMQYRTKWRSRQESHLRPQPSQSCALITELREQKGTDGVLTLLWPTVGRPNQTLRARKNPRQAGQTMLVGGLFANAWTAKPKSLESGSSPP